MSTTLSSAYLRHPESIAQCYQPSDPDYRISVDQECLYTLAPHPGCVHGDIKVDPATNAYDIMTSCLPSSPSKPQGKAALEAVKALHLRFRLRAGVLFLAPRILFRTDPVTGRAIPPLLIVRVVLPEKYKAGSADTFGTLCVLKYWIWSEVERRLVGVE